MFFDFLNGPVLRAGAIAQPLPVFGIHEGDPRLIVLGASGVVASLLVLARVLWLRAGRAPAASLVKAS